MRHDRSGFLTLRHPWSAQPSWLERMTKPDEIANIADAPFPKWVTAAGVDLNRCVRTR
jgi:hypothetical protein